MAAAKSSATATQLAQAQVVEAQRCVRCCLRGLQSPLSTTCAVRNVSCAVDNLQMKLMSIEVRGKPPAIRKAMQAKVGRERVLIIT